MVFLYIFVFIFHQFLTTGQLFPPGEILIFNSYFSQVNYYLQVNYYFFPNLICGPITKAVRLLDTREYLDAAGNVVWQLMA